MNDLLNTIYDTLMQNEQHEQFDINALEDTQIDNATNTITLEYKNATYTLSIQEVKQEYCHECQATPCHQL